MNFFILFSLCEIFFQDWKKKCNVTNVFITRFDITDKNLSGDWTICFTVIASISFPKLYFQKREKKIEKIYMDSEKLMNSFKMKKG